MYDIHYHLIFDVDDGPATLEQSLELAQVSIDDGVTYVVGTPHASERYPFRPDVNRERLELLKERLKGKLELGLGCDFHLSHENIEHLFQNPSKYTINGKQYLLVEFPDYGIAPTIGSTFHRMQSAGVTPILTHPERNPILMANPTMIWNWLKVGCLVQVTAGSLLGKFGPQCEAFAHKMVKRNWAHVVASDAHYLKGRWPPMAEAYRVLENQYGEDVAHRLCVRNPRAIVQGQSLEIQPEPEERDPRAQRRWSLAQLFGR